MANTHLAHPDLAIDNFSGTNPDQDAETIIELIKEKSTSLLETHLEMIVNWQTTHLGRKRSFLLYSKDQPLIGMRITLPTLPPWRMSGEVSTLDFQMDETNFDTKRKWNIAS